MPRREAWRCRTGSSRSRGWWKASRRCCHKYFCSPIKIIELLCFFKMGPFPVSFFLIFVFSIQLTINVRNKYFANEWTQTADPRSDRATNWATTAALELLCLHGNNSTVTHRPNENLFVLDQFYWKMMWSSHYSNVGVIRIEPEILHETFRLLLKCTNKKIHSEQTKIFDLACW